MFSGGFERDQLNEMGEVPIFSERTEENFDNKI